MKVVNHLISSILLHRGATSKNIRTIISLRNDYDDGNKKGKKALALDKQNINDRVLSKQVIVKLKTIFLPRALSPYIHAVKSRFFVHLLNEDSSLKQTVCFDPGERKSLPLHYLFQPT